MSATSLQLRGSSGFPPQCPFLPQLPWRLVNCSVLPSHVGPSSLGAAICPSPTDSRGVCESVQLFLCCSDRMGISMPLTCGTSFWGPNPVLNFAPCLLWSTCLSHSMCFPSRPLHTADGEFSGNTNWMVLFERKEAQRPRISLSVQWPAWPSPPGALLGTSAAPHF